MHEHLPMLPARPTAPAMQLVDLPPLFATCRHAVAAEVGRALVAATVAPQEPSLMLVERVVRPVPLCQD